MNWLRHYLKANGLTPSELSRRLDTSRQNVDRVLKAQRLPREWAERISPVIKVEAVNLMYGPEARIGELAPASKLVHSVPLRGDAGAGLWRERQETSPSQNSPVSALSGRWPVHTQFAYRIVGQSVDKLRIEDGDFVICVPYDDARMAPAMHDIVVVEKSENGRIETTCKQVVITPDAVELWPRSSDPQWQTPYRIPRTPGTDVDPDVRIIGLVVGTFRPIS